MDKAEIEAENHYQGALAMCSQKGNPKKGGDALRQVKIRGYLPSGQAWTLYLSHRRKLCCQIIWHILHTCRADIHIETRIGRRHRTVLD